MWFHPPFVVFVLNNMSNILCILLYKLTIKTSWKSWNHAGLLLIWPLGTNFSEILIEIDTFSFRLKTYIPTLLYLMLYWIRATKFVCKRTKQHKDVWICIYRWVIYYRAHVNNSVSAHNWSFIKTLFAFIFITVFQSGHKFALGTAAQRQFGCCAVCRIVIWLDTYLAFQDKTILRDFGHEVIPLMWKEYPALYPIWHRNIIVLCQFVWQLLPSLFTWYTREAFCINATSYKGMWNKYIGGRRRSRKKS